MQMSVVGADKSLVKYRANQLSERDLTGSAARWQARKDRALLANDKLNLPDLSAPTELKVLAIRVEFQKDEETTTTGDGKFDLSRATSLQIDPPPHDRNYFEAQLRALATYYRKVSNQKLLLKGIFNEYGDVYPRETDRAYQLPYDMPYYGANETEDLRDERLVQLFHDAWTAADQEGGIDFAQYDCFIVFHAGVGGDFAFDYDESPYDIASAFLSVSDLRKYLGDDSETYQGIPVQNASFFIPDGIILPETQSQNELEFGMLGTAALMFGSQIGLPSLFDVETGRSGIGRWGLMDQGSGNYTGLIPAQPCAWSKIFMGWVEPTEITSGERIQVAASLAKETPKIYKIPINSNEYFLIENRQQHMLKQPDLAVAYDQNGVRVELRRDGTITQSADTDSFKVLVSVDEYDFDCPGSGILIWHIDERVIEENYAANRINANPDLRGVDLEEAHGSQDIGGQYGFLHPASGSENGISENAFYDQNESNMTVNQSETVAFTPDTKPGSWSNTRANTHIYITNFSSIDSIMYFDLRNRLAQTGFPQSIAKRTHFLKNSLLASDLNADGSEELLALSRDGKIYCWNGDGSAFIGNDYLIIENDLLNRPDTLAVALFASAPDSIHEVPATVDFTGNGQRVVIAGTKQREIYAWKSVDANSDGQADLLENFPLSISAPVSTPALVSDRSGTMVVFGLKSGKTIAVNAQGLVWETVVGTGPVSGLAYLPSMDIVVTTTESGEIALVNAAGQATTMQQLADAPIGQPVVGDIDADESPEIVVPFDDGLIRVFNSDLSIQFERRLNTAACHDVVLADLNQDGFLEILASGTHQLIALNHTGSYFENFPVELVWSEPKSDFAYSPPVVMNLDDEGTPEILIGGENGDLLAFESNGEMVQGFPLTTAGAISSCLQIARIDADSDFEIVTLSEDNSLYVWDWQSTNPIPEFGWTGYLGNAKHWAYAETNGQPEIEDSQLLSVAYNYPNPTEGAFTTIRYELAKVSEVNIKIFDIAGELILELPGTGVVNIPNEVVWQLDQVESGIYLAKIEATSTESSQTESRFVKIAVVK